jgi:hypothetical protein
MLYLSCGVRITIYITVVAIPGGLPKNLRANGICCSIEFRDEYTETEGSGARSVPAKGGEKEMHI